MNDYDKLKLKGLEAFDEFRYYKGEKECPYNQAGDDPVTAQWWHFEKDYFDNYKKSGQWKTFSEFFDHWIKEKAAPEVGHDLSKGNPWKQEYEANAPF